MSVEPVTAYYQVNFTRAGDDLIVHVRGGDEEAIAYISEWLRSARADRHQAPAVLGVHPPPGAGLEMRQTVDLSHPVFANGGGLEIGGSA